MGAIKLKEKNICESMLSQERKYSSPPANAHSNHPMMETVSNAIAAAKISVKMWGKMDFIVGEFTLLF